MTDLLFGALFLTLTSALFFVLGRVLVQRATGVATDTVAATPRMGAGLAALAVVAALIVLLLFLQDRLLWAKLLPHPGVMVLANPALPLIALLAGILRAYGGQKAMRRTPVAGALLLLGAVYTAKPFWGAPPRLAPERQEAGVVLQTSFSSCSAASAATLLRYHGLSATEREMAGLCLTRADGTAMLGVYRGLRHKTEGSPWRVEVLSGVGEAALRRAAEDGPVLISVGLDRFPAAGTDTRYESQWGWTPGLRHAVVLFRFFPADARSPRGRIDIGDPSVGRERWEGEALDVLWRGEGLRLVRRK